MYGDFAQSLHSSESGYIPKSVQLERQTTDGHM